MTPYVYENPAYRRSRSAYRLFCMLEYFIALLVSDVYLFKLLTSAGLSDGNIGIVSSLITVACLFQLSSIGFVRRVRNVKRWVIAFCLISQTVFVLLYLLPFLPLDVPGKTVLAFSGILLGYFFCHSVTSILFQWANSYVDPRRRALYSAEKEMMSLLGGMIFTFALGVIMDRFELANRLPSAFIVIMAVGLLINLASFTALMRIDGKWEREEEFTSAPSLRTVAKDLLHNRGFIQVVVLSVLWNCAQYFTIGFLGSYKSKELMLSMGTVQAVNILANVCRFLFSKPLGRYADRTSYAKCIEMALYIAAAGFLTAAFATPSLRWFIAVFTMLIAISYAGITQNLFNIVYDHVPAAYFVQASAIRNCIGGICGFCASLAGSWILDEMQKGNSFFGIAVYGQQVLSLLSFLLTVVAALYVRFVMQEHSRACAQIRG